MEGLITSSNTTMAQPNLGTPLPGLPAEYLLDPNEHSSL